MFNMSLPDLGGKYLYVEHIVHFLHPFLLLGRDGGRDGDRGGGGRRDDRRDYDDRDDRVFLSPPQKKILNASNDSRW